MIIWGHIFHAFLLISVDALFFTEAPKSVPSPGKRAGARGRYIYPLSKYLRLDEGRGIPFDDYFMKDLTNGQPPLDWELQYTQQYPFVQELDRASKPVTRSSVTGLILRALHDHLNQPTQLSAGGLIRDLLKERTMQRKYQEAQMECESMDGQSPSFLRNLCQLLGETVSRIRVCHLAFCCCLYCDF